MEETLATAEARVASLLEETARPETATRPSRMKELAAELEAAQKEVERLYARWEELTS
jgi:exonuclease VII small subunit